MDWSDITFISDTNIKASSFQNTIREIVDKHCPVTLYNKRHAKTPWFDDKARKLRNAKCRSMKKNYQKWEPFTQLLREHLRQAKKKRISSRLKKKEEKSKNPVQTKPNSANCTPLYSIDNQFMSTAQTCSTLNNYLAHI